jgi:hypothetical protein
MPPKLFQVRAAPAQTPKIRAMAIGPRSGRVFASAGDDGILNLYSVTDPNPIYRFGPFSAAVSCCTFDYTEEVMAFGTDTGLLVIMDLDSAKTLGMWHASSVPITCVDFHPQSPEVIVAGDSVGHVCVFGIALRSPLQQFAAHRGSVSCVRVCPQGNLLISAGSDRCLRIFDITTGEFQGTIQSNCLPFLSIAFHPTDQVLAACSESRTVHFFDIDRRCETKGGLLIGPAPPQCIRFSQDGSVVAVCSTATVSLFKAESPDFADHLPISLSNAHDLQLYSTGVAVATSDGAIASVVMMKKEEFRLLQKKKKADVKQIQPKVIDGLNMGAPNFPSGEKRVKKPPPPANRVLAELQPKGAAPPAPVAQANDALYRDFKFDRAQYVAILSQRQSKMAHLRDVIKKRGFHIAATEVASAGEGIAEFLTILQLKPEIVRLDNAAVCIDAMQFAFKTDAATAVVVLGQILNSVGGSISVVTGGEEAAQIMETIHGIAPIVSKAADRGVPGARQLLDAWPRLLR